MAKNGVRLNIPVNVGSLTSQQYQNLLAGKDINAKTEEEEKKPKKKRRIYNNTTVENEHGKFDSIKEYDVFKDLKLLEDKGKIKNLVHKKKYDLLPTIRTEGYTYRKITYEADFVYEEDGKIKVVDVKAWSEQKQKYIMTKTYRLKKHLMLYIHKIEIKER